MEKFISTDRLIEKAKAKGINFGKGNPYNRLRYYTKMGWLPHVIRKKDENGKIKGHYPTWSLIHLITIEKLKDRGLTNPEISKKLASKNKFANFVNLLKDKEIRNQLISCTVFGMILIIMLSELNILRLGKPKKYIAPPITNQLSTILIDSGSGFVPKGMDSIFIKTPGINKSMKIHITFNQDYFPATRYWIEEIRDQVGFVLQLDSPVYANPDFNWWLSN